MKRQILSFWFVLVLGCVALFGQNARADSIDVQHVFLQSDAKGWSIDAQFAFTLNHSLEEVVNRGIPLYFTTDFELTYPRWWWFDQKVILVSRTLRLSFQPLTREYKISIDNGLQLRFTSLKQALAVIAHVTNWHVIDANQVNIGDRYIVGIRLHLDVNLMAKPFQIDAVNNRDWRLDSDWKKFPFWVVKREK